MARSRVKILFVEDDPALGYMVKTFLQKQDFELTFCTDAAEAWRSFMKGAYDLCVLDVVLPGKKDGLELAKNIREKNADIPIIMASARNLETDRISGLEQGVDDYISKPYNPHVLLAKINVFLKRRKGQNEEKSDMVTIGNFLFDYKNLLLHDGAVSHTLTNKEAELVKYLSLNPNKLIKREDILTSIWGKDDYFLGRSMDVFIARIRKYFRSQNVIKLQTIHGIGYKFINKYEA